MKELLLQDMDSVMKSQEPTLVMFYAHWCGFCRRFAPIFSKAERRSPIPLARIDIDQDEDSLWDAFNIKAVPTLIAFRNGKQIARKDSPLGFGLTQKSLDEIFSEIAQNESK